VTGGLSKLVINYLKVPIIFLSLHLFFAYISPVMMLEESKHLGYIAVQLLHYFPLPTIS